MSVIAITDHITNPDIEKDILGDLAGMQVGKDTEVLLVWHEQIDGEFLNKTPNLKGVQRYGVGFDTLDLKELQSRGVVVCNNPDYGVDEVSDTAVAMILNIARGVTVYDHHARACFDTWQENVNNRIKRNSEITVGVIGAGRIGGSVILKCNALKFKTLFYDKYKESGHEKVLSAERVDSLNELLEHNSHFLKLFIIRRSQPPDIVIEPVHGRVVFSDDFSIAFFRDRILHLQSPVTCVNQQPPQILT